MLVLTYKNKQDLIDKINAIGDEEMNDVIILSKSNEVIDTSNITSQDSCTISNDINNQDQLAGTIPATDGNDTIVKVSLLPLHDKPVLEFEKSDEDILVVQKCDNIPNSCSASKVTILDRELILFVCEENGKKKASIDVEINGNIIRKHFLLETDQSKKNSIKI